MGTVGALTTDDVRIVDDNGKEVRIRGLSMSGKHAAKTALRPPPPKAVVG
jgi:hypothetical protein